MRRDLTGVAVAALALGLALAAVAVVASVSRERLLDVYVLLVGSLLLLVLVRWTAVAGGQRGLALFERALVPRRRRPQRPEDLETLERTVVLAASSAFDLHTRLRPLLREVTADRLASARGLRLDSGSAEVRAAVGEELWDVVRPDRELPEHRFAPGLAVDRLAAHVDTLERI